MCVPTEKFIQDKPKIFDFLNFFNTLSACSKVKVFSYARLGFWSK